MHPWVFMVLIVPFGVVSGFVSVALAFHLTRAGVSVGQVAGIVALVVLPHTWKFLWAPIIDATLTQKAWYWIGAVLTAVGIAVMGALPPTAAGLAFLSGVVFVTSSATSFIGMAVESLMAHATPEHEKGRAGGWFQAGNLGGSGIGGGLGLWLAQHLSSAWLAGAIVAVLCFLCSLALFLVPTPSRSHATDGFWKALRDAITDLWVVIREKSGTLALILCFLPIGSGAASGLWSAVAGEWNAGPDTVALVTGILAGVISAVGCVIGGWICDRMDRRLAYLGFGLLQAGAAVALALLPRTPTSFVVLTSLYALITGFTYAGFTAFVLEAIGKGAAATKYSVYASLSNMPIYYMTWIEGAAHDRLGSGGMLLTEAVLGTAGAVVFVALMFGLGARFKSRAALAIR
ncbi:MAG TPA: MFS transporter [Candidatus Eisenbacteria bacterium]